MINKSSAGTWVLCRTNIIKALLTESRFHTFKLEMKVNLLNNGKIKRNSDNVGGIREE